MDGKATEGNERAGAKEVTAMGFWTNMHRGTAFNDPEELADEPTGGPLKKRLARVGAAPARFCCGVYGLCGGQVSFFGRRAGSRELHGSAAVAMFIAYLSVGAFIHFHWFWGLHPRLRGLSQLFKALAVLAFLGSFGFTIYRGLA